MKQSFLEFLERRKSREVCFLPELSVSVNSGIFGWVFRLSTISVFSGNIHPWEKFPGVDTGPFVSVSNYMEFFMELIAIMYSRMTMFQNGVAEHRCVLVS